MKMFHVSAEGDDLYFSAPDLNDARAQFAALCGQVPESLLTWDEVTELPEDEEVAADVR